MNKGAKILVADDDWEDRFLISDSFKEIGHPDIISIVDDGEKVIEYLEKIQDKNQYPSLIVLDLNMPRLNGTETLRVIKNNLNYRNIRVIIYSTSVNDNEKRECLKIGAMSYITKPAKYSDSINIAKEFYHVATTA